MRPTYAKVIARYTSADPRLVEASMRLQYGTLDHLSGEDFRRECAIAEAMIANDPHAMEELARTYGL